MNDGERVSATRAIRRAARLLVLDPEDRLLLFRFTFGEIAPFWATPGGGCDPGESFEDAARRELFEETGFDVCPGPPIAARSNDFTTFEGQDVTADERYFLIRVAGGEIDPSGHTELEREAMREWRWFAHAELAAWHEHIWPVDIAGLVAKALEP